MSGMVCSGKPAGRIKKTISLLINGNATAESLALLKNVKADEIEISLKIVLTLLLTFGQPSRNSILTSYVLIQVKYTCSLEQDGHGIVISKKAQETFVAANSFLFPVHSSKKINK